MRTWHVKDIILVTLIGVVVGLIFWIMDPIYTAVTALLTPIGLAPFSGAVLLGFWTIGGPLALMIIKKPGSGLLAEFLGAAVEMLLGGIWGAATLISGLVQGLGSELGFACLGYKNYGKLGMLLSTLTTTIVTFGFQLIKHDYSGFSYGMILALFLVSFISVFLFSGVLSMAIAKMFNKAHLLDENK